MLVGKKIFLRAVLPIDVEKLLEWENDTENWEVSSTETMFTREEIAFFVASKQQIETHGQTRFMICLETEENTIGCIDLFDFNAEEKKIGVGILIGEKQHRRKGYAKEALCLLSNFCFNKLAILTIFSEILESNSSSIRLFESCGFVFKKTNLRNGKTMRYYELNPSTEN